MLDRVGGFFDDDIDGGLRVTFEFKHGQAAGMHRGQSIGQTGQFEAVLDHRHGPVQRGDDRVLVGHEHRGGRRGLGDVHDGHIEQLLQAFAAVFAVAGLHDRVVRAVVGTDGFHDRDGGHIAFIIALDRFGAEHRRDRHDFRIGQGDPACLPGDALRHRFGRIDVGYKNTHG